MSGLLQQVYLQVGGSSGGYIVNPGYSGGVTISPISYPWSFAVAKPTVNQSSYGVLLTDGKVVLSAGTSGNISLSNLALIFTDIPQYGSLSSANNNTFTLSPISGTSNFSLWSIGSAGPQTVMYYPPVPAASLSITVIPVPTVTKDAQSVISKVPAPFDPYQSVALGSADPRNTGRVQTTTSYARVPGAFSLGEIIQTVTPGSTKFNVVVEKKKHHHKKSCKKHHHKKHSHKSH
jgi:hypothetical protein